MKRKALLAISAIAAHLAATPFALAQTGVLAGKTARIVVPGPPGGPASSVAMFLAIKASQKLGYTVIADHKPGAAGNIAIENVAKSKPDGTSLMFAAPFMVTNPHFMKQSVDPFSFDPVIQPVYGPYMMMVSAKSDIKSVPEAIARIKARPGETTCVIGVALSTTSCYLLQAGSAAMNMIGYLGNAQGGAAVERGEVDILFDFMNTAGAAVRAGRMRALAVTSAESVPGEFNALPPISQFVPGFELIGWQGIMVPRGTPADIVATLNKAFNEILVDEETQKFLAASNLIISGGAPEILGNRVRRDFEFFGRVAKEAKIQPE